MSWKPIVVGVDATLEAARAAEFGERLAEAAGTRCALLHIVSTPHPPPAAWSEPRPPGGPSREAHARETVLHALWGVVSPRLLQELEVRPGRAPVALREAAHTLGAEVIVLGRKRHTVVGQWLGYSTALHLARTADVPVLVTGSASLPTRVLAAVDTSAAARLTIEAAQRYATLCKAALRVVSVVELLPVTGDLAAANFDPTAYYASARTEVERDVWPLVTMPGAQKQLRFGRPLESIQDEVEGWSADLVVVGSHGRGWVERALLGSVTERLLRQVPVSMLIVPAHEALSQTAQGAKARDG
jgi:nucleotide-binding universal stress UspA family protein